MANGVYKKSKNITSNNVVDSIEVFTNNTILTYLTYLATVCFNLYFYRPQTKLRKGNVFTSACQEFCPRGGDLPQCMLGYTPRGVCLSACWNTPPSPRADPPGQAPPSRRLEQRTVRNLLECILV